MRVGDSLGAMRKTGLGSSAALVSCLVGAMLHHTGAVTLTRAGGDAASVQCVHNLAQFAHCLAQRKIGSGFDVASAVYGSQVYVRFSPQCLDPFLRAVDAQTLDGSGLVRLAAPWDNACEPLRLPSGMALVLGDVSVGSNTPLMVSQVLKWRADRPQEAHALWTRIDQANTAVRAGLQQLQSVPSASLHDLCAVDAAQWAAHSRVGEVLSRVREAFCNARAGLREMGQAASVDIEPFPQTRLCDATMSLPGVLAAGVPGAGGFDAIFALVLSVDVIPAVEELWVKWAHDSVTVVPMIVREDPRGLCIDED